MFLPKRRRRERDAAALLEELAAVARARGSQPDPETDRRLLELRHRAGLALLESPRPLAAAPAAADGWEALRPGATAIPEIAAADLTTAAVRAAVGEHGCVIVRGLLDRADAEGLAGDIDRAYASRERQASGDAEPDGWSEEFRPDPRFDLAFERAAFSQAGWASSWAADSPAALGNVLDAFERAGLRSLVSAYLGEHPAISVNKCVLRRVRPDVFGDADGSEGVKPSAWHQDGAFMGSVKALNVWLALSRCGDVAPGMDIVPRRIDRFVEAGTEGAAFSWSVSQAVAEREAGASGLARPVFDPGDALLFDEMLLHSTAAEPDMPAVRYAVECWFFGPSAFPEGYAPLAF